MILETVFKIGTCRGLSTSAAAKAVSDVYIVSCARTPSGAFQGTLSSKSATELGSVAIRHAIERISLPKEAVQEVNMGCVLQAGVGQAPARQAALFAGLETSTPCTTINKVCASGMKAIMISSASLALGQQDVMVAGGMESLSNSPFYLARGSTPYGQVVLKDSCNFDALTDVYSSWHMGKCAENSAMAYGITRPDQDAYARLSHERTIEAKSTGIFKGEVFPVKIDGGKEVTEDDENMATYSISDLPDLPTPWGSMVSRGSSSKLADGAAACVLMNETGLQRCNVQPLARILGYNDAAQDPVEWPTSPAKGIRELLKKLQLKKSSVALWEINEAFATVVLANVRLLDLDVDKVNVHGGAIAMGHPFGMSGARITNHLVHALKAGEIGVASLCNGGGGAATIAIEKL